MIFKGQIPSLNGFRAISILLVILSHLVYQKSLPPPLQIIFKEIGYGDLGVRFFFVISGFLITYLLLKEKQKIGRVDLKAFYIRRFLRIFPPFYVFLLVIAILNFELNLRIPALCFLSAALYIQNFSPWGESWFINHSWSLAVEEQFYLLWPAIFLAIKKVRGFSTWLIAIAAGSFFRSLHYKFPELSDFFLAPFFMHADFLFSGCFIAFMSFYNSEKLINFTNSVSSVFVYCALACLWGFSKYEFHPVYDSFFIPISGAVLNISISFLIIYFVLKPNTFGFKFLNLRWMNFIGLLSYSVYLWQQLYISKTDYWWTKFPQNIVFTFLTAYLSFRLIEKPFLRIKDKFKIIPIDRVVNEVPTSPITSMP